MSKWGAKGNDSPYCCIFFFFLHTGVTEIENNIFFFPPDKEKIYSTLFFTLTSIYSAIGI